MDFTPLIEVGKSFGIYGVIGVLVVLILVFVARKAGIVATGNHARIANIVLSAILAGLAGDPAAETALTGALISIVSGLLFELISWINKKVSK